MQAALIVWQSTNKESKSCWVFLLLGYLFQPVWSAREWQENSSSLSCLNCSTFTHYTTIQLSGPGLESPALIFCTLHFHINPLEYLSSTFAEIIKALADPRSHCEGEGEIKTEEGSSVKLSRLTWDIWPLLRVIQQCPASAHLCLPPNEASRLGWNCGGAPPVARLTPCSSSVASQMPLVTRWDYKLPVLKA